MESELPHLVCIDDDVLSTGVTLYHLKVVNSRHASRVTLYHLKLAIFQLAISVFRKLFQNEAKGKTLLLKKSYIYMRIKSNYHINNFALSLAFEKEAWSNQLGMAYWLVCRSLWFFQVLLCHDVA